jgi:ribonuclease P protein component
LGKSFYSKLFGVKMVANGLTNNRYGIIISSKVSKKAVERNKLKRQIRVVLRKLDKHLNHGYDLIIIVLPIALNQGFDVVSAELEKISLKLKLFKPGK